MDASRSQQIDPKAQAQAWDFIFSFVPALVLKSALLLKIPDIIARAGPDAHLSLQQIAAQLPTQNPSLDYLSRILRYLAVKSIFTHSTATDTSEVRYGLTDMAKLFFVPMLIMHTNEVLGTISINVCWKAVKLSKKLMAKMCGLMEGAIRRYPTQSADGILLPGSFWRWNTIVLHDWDDERCLKILENCHKAPPENGKIMLAETVLPEHSDPNQGIEILSDLVMIAHANGGRERSEGQWGGRLEKGRLLWNQNRRKS
eukprot:Gb_23396 [translate_table: standard]